MVSENEKITRVDIETTMKTAYIDYAMSVIVGRGHCRTCATGSNRCTAAYSIR